MKREDLEKLWDKEYPPFPYYWSRKGEERRHKCPFNDEPCRGIECKAWLSLKDFCHEFCPCGQNVFDCCVYRETDTICFLLQSYESFEEYGLCMLDIQNPDKKATVSKKRCIHRRFVK